MTHLPPPDDGATCLITGASAGIGAALARELASRGYGVTVLARRDARLRALANELTDRYGVRAEVLRCDLANSSDRALVASQIEDLGLRIDVLISNAGIGSNGRFIELPVTGEIEQVRVLCEALVELCGAFVPGMAERQCGAVLIVSSAGAFQPMPNIATYAAAKSFALSFGESLHAELRNSGVAVTTLCPGPVQTEFFRANGPHPTQRVTPRPMWKSPQEVARLGIEGLVENRRVVIPGLAVRATVTGSRLVPRRLWLRLLDRFYQAPDTAEEPIHAG